MADKVLLPIPEMNSQAAEQSSSGIEQYCILLNAFFGFKEMPFLNTSDPHFLFMSKRHRDAFMNLLFGVEERRGFIILTGEIGAGKSTMCRYFLNKLPRTIKTAVVLNPNMAAKNLLATIVKDFGIECGGKTKNDYFDALNHFLLAGLESQQNACLIIDEAQCLSVKLLEEIRLLSNLETCKQKLLQIVLMGQPELKDLLMRPELTQLRQRIGVFYHLQGLDLDETRDYIRHRLELVREDSSEVVFTDSAIAKIHEVSRGIPRLINSLCDRTLMAAYAEQTKEITAEVARAGLEDMAFVYA